MNTLEINASGNFESWSPGKIKELKDQRISNDLGQNLIFENENIRLWEVILLPNERLPFRKINMDYSWVSLTSGLAISRYADGKIILMRIDKGDSAFLKCKEKTYIYDLENKGNDILFFHLTEFKHQTIKKYLSKGVRLKANKSSND
ncbi:hypothetical protein [Maribacter arenosus]|uniref:Uncharacterized protein n=1 Tax=Maribacter arenosus TaxID=1854708 RepID=A0ABR7VES1_9FLAO|nr:hypothetical protein [Maribacter arenosus]MBD0852155.1 hypothetical protein [Maribacter arenosus]